MIKSLYISSYWKLSFIFENEAILLDLYDILSYKGIKLCEADWFEKHKYLLIGFLDRVGCNKQNITQYLMAVEKIIVPASRKEYINYIFSISEFSKYKEDYYKYKLIE